MNEALAWGLTLIRGVQGAMESPALTVVMKAITALGSEYAYLLLVPAIYWCVDERKGLRLGIVVVLSGWLNGALKALWKQPRPFELDASVGLAGESGYGLPSGHAQGSATFWGVVAQWIRAPWGLILAILVPLVIGFTRIYLGVHFPTDVLAGWALAAAILGFYYAFGKLIEAALAASGLRGRLIATAAVTLIMNALHPSDTSLGGVFLGMGVGYALLAEYRPFSAATGADGGPASLLSRILRFLIGAAGLVLVYIGLKSVFPREGASLYQLFRFFRYGAVGLWVSAGAPLLFLALGLAGRREGKEA